VTIVQKGINGLGDRLRVLGECVDMAEATGRYIYPDWRDKCWRLGFFDYFSLEGDIAPERTQYVWPEPYVWPKPWTMDNLWCECPQTLLGKQCLTHFAAADIPHGVDVAVACRPGGQYSDKFFHVLHISQEIVDSALSWLRGNDRKPGEYRCFHVRHTDRETDDESLKSVREELQPGDVIITDNHEVAKWGDCPSYTFPVKRSGLHKQYGVDDGTKHALNVSSIRDMIIGGLSGEFVYFRSDSSYSQFIQRSREAGYWRKLV